MAALVAGQLPTGLLPALLYAGTACAQGYPARPIRVVTAEAGGGSGVIPIEIVAKAPPDGYTLLVFGSALWLLPFLQNVSYDPLKDIAPIAVGAVTPLVVVHPSLPVKSIKDMIAAARARPGELNYASGIAGSVTHLPAELFKAMTGVNITRVTYKGGAPALNAILGGEVQVMFAAAATATPHINSGRLRALAVTTAQPSALFPGLPTVAAEALPGYESVAITGVYAPGRTPASLIDRLSSEIGKVLDRPEIQARFQKSGFEVVPGTPQQFTATIKAEMARMGKVIRDAGIRAE